MSNTYAGHGQAEVVPYDPEFPGVMWKIYTYFGNDLPLGMSKEIPKGMLPPLYVGNLNNKGFLPYEGEFERVRIDEETHAVWYERTNFLGGK